MGTNTARRMAGSWNNADAVVTQLREDDDGGDAVLAGDGETRVLGRPIILPWRRFRHCTRIALPTLQETLAGTSAVLGSRRWIDRKSRAARRWQQQTVQ